MSNHLPVALHQDAIGARVLQRKSYRRCTYGVAVSCAAWLPPIPVDASLWFLLARAATRLGIGFLEVLLDGFFGGIPVPPLFPGLEIARSRELAEVIDRGVEQGCQLLHRQEVCRAFHTGLQVEVERLFHGESDQVDQRGVLANVCLLQCLNIARTPFSEHQRRWVAILYE